jgi:hypothetical protein
MSLLRLARSSAALSVIAAMLCTPSGVGASPAAAQAAPRDAVGAEGIVYRYVDGYGYRFHPLANFAELNRQVSRGDRWAAHRLARALVRRSVPNRGALVWEYGFPFGGPVPWRSGFAQAVAAQALARAALLTGDTSLERAARAARRAITLGLARPLAGGVWVREYGFTDMAVLNAQLQSLVSLKNYSALTGDATGLVAALERASKALLRKFDTGCWSRYSLWGRDAPVRYHAYHVELLTKLAARDPDPLWRRTRDRWERYLERRRLPCAARA